jgi:acyl-CoA synthetase (AMP-forming)/AMP-acid ligase II
MTRPADFMSLTLNDFERRFADRHLLHGVVQKWAREKPSAIALIDADRKQEISWAAFDHSVTAVAARLTEGGFRKGDCFASMLPLVSEHIILEYACFKTGVIFVPLDLRSSPTEVLRSLTLVDAKGFAFIKTPGASDLAALVNDIRSRLSLRMLLQLSAPGECLEGALPAESFFADAMRIGSSADEYASAAYLEARHAVNENDGALVIFTTGSTGSPKPALLSHRNITCQNMCISQALFNGDSGMKTLVNLPASHVGCQTELLMGTFFGGGTAVILPNFDPVRSLKAIQDFKVEVVGQIPAMLGTSSPSAACTFTRSRSFFGKE